ncbi:MAG: NADPH:quinone reductase [Segetibacter sp.]|nr:NADPH:quinone reductase [Segetibacter sp.]
MKAIKCHEYGSTEVLQLSDVEKPSYKSNEVLIRNYATTVTAADTMMRKGKPYIGRLYLGLSRPNKAILGFEFAGEIVEIGKDVSLFKIGDKVFGGTTTLGCYAEYVSVSEEGLLITMPNNTSYEEACPVSGSGVTVLNYLKVLGKVKKGDKVLINGASGGLGTYAVQFAKHVGAEVTGVCSTANTAMVKSLGAHKVIDYTMEDFTKGGQLYNIIFDTVGKRSFSDCKKALTSHGVYLSPIINFQLFLHTILSLIAGSKKVKFSFTGMVAVKERLAHFIELKELLATGKIKTVVGKQYSLSQIGEAHTYVETGHKKGNVVIVV